MKRSEEDCQILYIDTGGKFSPLVALEMLEEKQLLDESQRILQKIIVVREISTPEEMFKFLIAPSPTVSGIPLQKFKMIVVDCITNLISPLFFSDLASDEFYGSALMSEIGKSLKRVAWNLRIPIVVINHAVMDRNSTEDRDSALKPALGETWSTIIDQRYIVDTELKLHVLRLL